MCALRIRSDGTQESVSPINGVHFQLPELYQLINCKYIEIMATKDGRIMIVDEDGKRERKPVNKQASVLYRYGAIDPIVGDVLICDRSEVR